MEDLRVMVEKEGMFGLFTLTFLPLADRWVLSSQDPRHSQPVVVVANNESDARKSFDECVALSRDRGWTVVYYGRPHFG